VSASHLRPKRAASIIEELDEALSGQTIASRAEKLRRVSDLFLEGPSAYSEREIALFDDVMMRLVDEMETSVRGELAERLAAVPNAPLNLMRKLAADQAIEVAGPVLANSPRLDDAALVEYARSKEQPHLLAISKRESVSEAVADILVDRGDRVVALSTVRNSGARFSEDARALLVERAKNDGDIAAGVWSRPDVPRHQLLRLFTLASENVRRALENTDRRKTAFIRDMVADVAERMQSRLRVQSRDYAAAQAAVREVFAAGRLNEAELIRFAKAGGFDETTVALSIMCDLPVGAVERAMVQDRDELVLLLARAIGLSWEATKTVLGLRSRVEGLTGFGSESALATFSRLRAETARKALHFLRLRERATWPERASGKADAEDRSAVLTA
jgi:uncharacterized protein (DUF2336 family)